MATITSVYLSNRYVQAVVGKTGKRLRMQVLCDDILPEGCLINGVITSERDLATALKAFWEKNSLPTKNVHLVIESTQFLSRMLSVPAMNEKKLRQLADRELNSIEKKEHPIADLMLLGADKKAKTQTVLATCVEKSFLDSYLSLAKEMGITISCIDTALCSELKLLRVMPEFRGKTCIILAFDGDNLSSTLLEDGEYKYFGRVRLFSPHGTAAFSGEVAQSVSGTMQFQLSGKSDLRVTHAYFAGCSAEDYSVCADACTALGLEVAQIPDTPSVVQIPGSDWKLADCVFTAGNLIGR